MQSPKPPANARVRVLIVDDQELFANALTAFLERDDRVEVVGTASSGQEAIDLALEQYADVVLMDVFMRGINGLEATKRLRTIRPQTHVIVLSGLEVDDLGERASEAGADGHLKKGIVHEHLVDAILRVAQGQALEF